jgi:hypothetical protein
MTQQVARLLQDALLLPEGERGDLAAALIESLDPAVDDDAEAAWGEEIRQRVEELDQGSARVVPWSEARRRIMEDADDSVGH